MVLNLCKAAERGVSERFFFRDMVDGRVPLPRTDMLKITFPGLPFPSVWTYPLVVRHFQAVTLSSSYGFYPIFTLVLMIRQCAAETSKIKLIRPCHKAAILSRETKKPLFYHAKPHPRGFHWDAGRGKTKLFWSHGTIWPPCDKGEWYISPVPFSW